MTTNALPLASSPVLFVDTCSILDIIRDPTRDTARPHDMQAAIDLLREAEAGNLQCFMAEQVAIEFSEHDEPIQNEALLNLQTISRRLERINDLVAIFGATGDLDLSHLDGHVSRARSIVGRWLTQIQTIKPSSQAPGRAFARINAGKAPAKRGKDSSKDCLIYETVLEKAAAIRAENMNSPLVFMSSNTNDYCSTGGVLKPDIVVEFGKFQLGYAPNMSAAKHLLGL